MTRMWKCALLAAGLIAACSDVDVMSAEHPTIQMQMLLNGGIINNADVALRVAEILIENAYGREELERQQPLSAIDRGKVWVVEGSLNRDRKEEGTGTARIVIRKRDARVVEISIPHILFTIK